MQATLPDAISASNKRLGPHLLRLEVGAQWESAGSLRAGEAPGGTRARPVVETPARGRSCPGLRDFTSPLLFGVALPRSERLVDRLVQRGHEGRGVCRRRLRLLDRFRGLWRLDGLCRMRRMG